MTTPRTPVTLRARIYIPFITMSDYEDEDTTLPVRSAPLSPDYVLASPDYSLSIVICTKEEFYRNSFEDGVGVGGDYACLTISVILTPDSPNEDQTEAAESLHTQTALTPVVQPPPIRPLPTSSAIVLLPRQEIPLPPSTTSPSSPLPSLLPSSTQTLHAILASAKQETVTLRARVETLEQHDEVTRDSLRIARGRITRLQLRAVATEQHVTELQDSQVTDRLEISELRSRVEYAETRLDQSHALHARDKAAEQRAETLKTSLGATQMDITYLLESRRADRLEMVGL
ncbi:hypothetical protein Tco_0620982 [Tanacetum coccineum]